MNKGFTLVELIIVIIIVGILASVAMGQYAKAVEKSREAEARNILGSLRKLQIAYYVEHGEYTELPDFELQNDSTCLQPDSKYWFHYPPCMAFTGTCKAVRCAIGGRSPSVGSGKAYILEMTISGELTHRPYGS